MSKPTNSNFNLVSLIAQDMDSDKANELILAMSGLNKYGTGWNDTAEVWIYKGGKDFPAKDPAVVIRDNESNPNDNFQAVVGDFDGDGRQDLVTGGYYNDGVKLKFYFGSPTSPWSWSKPDRIVKLTDASDALGGYLRVLDADGDRIKDIFREYYGANNAGSYLYRSGSGKNARTRSFLLDDADQFYQAGQVNLESGGGYLNDSLHIYEMPIVQGRAYSGSPLSLLAFSGGPKGPDKKYKASYIGGLLYSVASTAMPDVTGDGWDDYIITDVHHNFDDGLAIVLAGGPYIPRDSIPASVVDVAVTGKPVGISLWPVPALDELHIAWRGDLPRMPKRFAVHDITGKLVAGGTIEPQLGAAVWHCRNAHAGTYLLSAFDTRGVLIATQAFIKQ